MKILPIFLFAAGVLVHPGDPLLAQTLTLNPIADTLTDGAQPANNYGQAGALGIAPAGAAKGEFDSFLKFDLSGAAGWTVQSITLQLTAASPNNPLFNGNGVGAGGTSVNTAGSFSIAWIQNSSWLEGTGTPSAPDQNAADLDFTNQTNYFPSGQTPPPLGSFSFNGAVSGAAIYSLPLTPGFLSAVQFGSQISLYLSAADANVNYVFNSENFGTASSRPVLKVVATPEPASLGLAASGLFLFVRRRRRN